MKPRLDGTLQEMLNNFDRSLSSSSDVDMKQLLGAFTMDAIIHVAFGVSVDSLADPENPIIAHAKAAFSTNLSVKMFATLLLLLKAPKLAQLFDIRYKRQDFFSNFARQIIIRKKADMRENPGKASCFLELLLEAEEQEEANQYSNHKVAKHMSTDEMVAQCLTFMLAGYETTSTTITLAAYLLALNPEVQEKLHQEIISGLEKLRRQSSIQPDQSDTELITLEALNQFDYLAAVISETLRLYPPAIAIERRAGADLVLQTEDGLHQVSVQKDDIILIPIYSMHRSEVDFPEPEAFQPERFLTSPDDQIHHKYAYLPFGSGPRNCVGKSLALFEAKLALLHLVRLYRFSPCSKTQIPVEMYYNNNLLIPRDIILRVDKRN